MFGPWLTANACSVYLAVHCQHSTAFCATSLAVPGPVHAQMAVIANCQTPTFLASNPLHSLTNFSHILRPHGESFPCASPMCEICVGFATKMAHFVYRRKLTSGPSIAWCPASTVIQLGLGGRSRYLTHRHVIRLLAVSSLRSLVSSHPLSVNVRTKSMYAPKECNRLHLKERTLEIQFTGAPQSAAHRPTIFKTIFRAYFGVPINIYANTNPLVCQLQPLEESLRYNCIPDLIHVADVYHC